MNFVLPFSAYSLLYQALSWINQYWTNQQQAAEFNARAFNNVVLFMSVALGAVAVSFLMDRKTAYKKTEKSFVILFSLLLCGAMLMQLWVAGPWFTVITALLGLVCGFLRPYFLMWLEQEAPFDKRGKLLTLPLFCAILIFNVFFILLFPQSSGSALPIKTIAVTFVFLIGMLSVFLSKGLKESAEQKESAEPKEPSNLVVSEKSTEPTAPIQKSQHFPSRFDTLSLLSLLGLILLLSLMIGIFDIAGSKIDYAAETYLTHARWVIPPFILLAGWLSDKFGRHVLILMSPILLLFGMSSMLLAWNGPVGFIGLCFIHMGNHALSISSMLIFLDHAGGAKRPALIGTLGFSSYVVSRQLGTILGMAVGGLDFISLYLIGVTFGLVSLGLIFFFYGRMRTNNLTLFTHSLQNERASEQPIVETSAPNIESLNLTPREKEVFEVILQGVTVPEMAQKLYISEVTVKRHVGSILKKTQLSSRAELLEVYREKQKE